MSVRKPHKHYRKRGVEPDDPTARAEGEKILFDVPVYRLSTEEYECRQKEFIQNAKKRWGGKTLEEFHRINPEYKVHDESLLWRIYGGAWLFNEIIGFIRLFFLLTDIRGEFFSVESKRIVRTRRKMFRSIGYEVTFPERIPHGSSNQEIFNHILKYLARAQREKELKGRYIYAAVLTNIGPYVNWKALLEDQFDHTKALNSPIH